MVGLVVDRKIGQGKQEGLDLVYVGLSWEAAQSVVGGSLKIRDRVSLRQYMLYHAVKREREREK